MTVKGTEAEIRALVAADMDGAAAEAAEFALFDDLVSPVALLAEHRGVPERGRGRPAGSKSRATADLVRYIRATRRPALLVLQDWAEQPVHELAAMLGCKLLEAADFQRKVIADLLPYVERRQPQALEVLATITPVLVMTSEPVRPDLAAGNPPIEGEAREVEQDQGFSFGSPEGVSPQGSHD